MEHIVKIAWSTGTLDDKWFKNPPRIVVKVVNTRRNFVWGTR
jgi:hypothetical protein